MKTKSIHRFTTDEDIFIMQCVETNGKNLGLSMAFDSIGEKHSKKAICERYRSFLSKDRSQFSKEDDEIILKASKQYKGQWAKISKLLHSDRSGDQVKIRYYQLEKDKERVMKKKMVQNHKNRISSKNRAEIEKSDPLSEEFEDINIDVSDLLSELFDEMDQSLESLFGDQKANF